MENEITNLQNRPAGDDVTTESVSFESKGNLLQGTLYRPSGATGRYPGAIVTGAWTTVKEQMPGTYARELALRGISSLAFDFTGWGASAGSPRYVEDPAVKTADIHAAAAYLAQRTDIDAGQISGVGICASSGYMAEAVADNADLRKLALVAPWLHDPEMAEGIYGGPDSVANLIAASEADNASDVTLVAASTTDETSVMYQAPYYTEDHRGLIAAYDNKFSVLSWKPWLTYDAQRSADRLDKPTLLIGSPAIALPVGVEAYEKRMTATPKKMWLAEDVTQFDFYDRSDVVTAASDAVASFFKA